MASRHILVSSIVLCALTITACSDTTAQTTLPRPTGSITLEKTEDWATIQTGNYRLANNVWNKAAATGSYAQSIFTETLNGQPAFGWSWQWPDSDDQVVAYPEVGHGYDPWWVPWDSQSDLPVQIGSGKTITANFNITVTATGSYDLAFDIWLTTTSPTPETTDITNEIMIWLDHTGAIWPGGTQIGSVVIGGTAFDIYQKDSVNGTNASWTYIAYVASSPVMDGPLTISQFLSDLVDRTIISNSLYVTQIELGNEVVGGSGVTEVENYLIDVE